MKRAPASLCLGKEKRVPFFEHYLCSENEMPCSHVDIIPLVSVSVAVFLIVDVCLHHKEHFVCYIRPTLLLCCPLTNVLGYLVHVDIHIVVGSALKDVALVEVIHNGFHHKEQVAIGVFLFQFGGQRLTDIRHLLGILLLCYTHFFINTCNADTGVSLENKVLA